MQFSRLYVLDGARGIAAFCILLFHVVPRSPFSNLYIAVDFFFVLSGFVLATSVSRINSLLSARKFISARFLRIFPMALAVYVYTACYDLLIILKHWILDEPQTPVIILNIPTLIVSFLMIQVFYEPAQWVNYPIWSLSAEWLTNIFVAMIRVFTAKGKYISILIGVCFVCASLVFESGAVNQIGRALLGFSAGLIAFEFRALLLKHQKITVTIFLSLVPVYFFIQDLGVLSSLVTVWPFAAGIIYLSQVNTTSSASRIYTKVGKYSYGFYMWHFPMLTLAGILIKAIGLNVATLFGTLLLIVLGSILSIIATKISLVFFEQPIKKKWVNKL